MGVGGALGGQALGIVTRCTKGVVGIKVDAPLARSASNNKGCVGRAGHIDTEDRITLITGVGTIIEFRAREARFFKVIIITRTIGFQAGGVVFAHDTEVSPIIATGRTR
eukprot:Lithocolla_globosa_v1_NODE_1535_length_2508_cov_2.929882.p5 type:complete len:109 gc:universal NODE_1535_length_2508_cov_2.929882:1602-1276(-)